MGKGARLRTRKRAAEALWPGRIGERNVFRRQADYWTIVYRGEAAILRDTTGLAYLAALLGSPGRDIDAADLAAGLSPQDRGAGTGEVGAALGAVADEEARRDVVLAIRHAVAEISQASPTLGEHLEASVTTGDRCAYRPGSGPPVRWRL